MTTRRRNRVKAIARWVSIGVSLPLLAGAGFIISLPWASPPDALFTPLPPTVEFLDRFGRTLRELTTTDSLSAEVTLQQIPQSLIDATLAAEDHRFWRHAGVDWRAGSRAVWDCLRHGHVISGGSTITQQLVKMAQPRPRNLWTKFVEMRQALRLEQLWPKERILCEYLNRLDYGNRRRGCASAAMFYFGQPAQTLSVAQAAFLAGLPQAPSRMNPHRHYDHAKKRQEWILGQMRRYGFLAERDYQRSRLERVQLAQPRTRFKAPHFIDLIWSQWEIRGGPIPGGPCQTTLDLEVQTAAETALRRHLTHLRDHHAGNGAVVVIENPTGEVLALVGSADFFALTSGQVNGAWAPRSAGSTFKPFTYLIAMERGATPASIVADVPTEYPTPTGIFTPVNYNHHCYGPLRYRLALANSLNIPAVKVLDSVGGPAVLLDRLLACGLTTLKESPDFYGLGLTIGNAEARLLELANAYACLARLGEFRPYRLLAKGMDSDRPSPSARNGTKANQVFDAEPAFLIADILSDSAARSLAFGLDSPLRFDFPVACKTGTSTDFRDNWAFGYTPEFTVGVWVGNFDGSPMERVSGISGAAPILHELFEFLHQHRGTAWYVQPDKITETKIHALTGKQVRQPAPGVSEKFIGDHLPPMEQADDYDSQGRIRLSAEYQSWLATSDNWLTDRVVLDRAARESNSPAMTHASIRLEILSPLPGSVFYLDRDLPDQGRRLRLRVTGRDGIQWRSPTLSIVSDRLGTAALLTSGRHELFATDTNAGLTSHTWLEVKNR